MKTETTASPRLDDARRLHGAIRALVRRFSIGERADVECCGMTVAQAATLEVLRADGPLRLGKLGRRLGVSPSTLTRNLERLEQRGWLCREPDPGDGRALRARLTAAGRAAGRRVERQELDFARSVLGRLDDADRRNLGDTLQRLLGAVRDATESCCPGAFEHLMTDFPSEETNHG